MVQMQTLLCPCSAGIGLGERSRVGKLKTLDLRVGLALDVVLCQSKSRFHPDFILGPTFENTFLDGNGAPREPCGRYEYEVTDLQTDCVLSLEF